MEEAHTDIERREFVRIDYTVPLAYKVCKQETLSKILEGYTVDISQSGLQCNLKDWVNINDILWLSFEKSILRIFEELEKRSLIYQSGVIGKVVRIMNNENGSYNVGLQFLTREEKI
ncbi:MAG: PilZ domain-containing protein [Candidatus Omnitrophota bacterium]|nr:PilZ domain-containing protein [Candidatus Omnitrophota bacterium]MBU1929208.1 PilZ domain-containing protein [Candidatus Omnitrophota bacterium]MBU2034543.1 PilZ domain-containing protein [Candidatus Omnitrophota bacterium]MBU2221202.1 PilZ domain-containing protein [Candidatus Omnitrophota bacterium]